MEKYNKINKLFATNFSLATLIIGIGVFFISSMSFGQNPPIPCSSTLLGNNVETGKAYPVDRTGNYVQMNTHFMVCNPENHQGQRLFKYPTKDQLLPFLEAHRNDREFRNHVATIAGDQTFNQVLSSIRGLNSGSSVQIFGVTGSQRDSVAYLAGKHHAWVNNALANTSSRNFIGQNREEQSDTTSSQDIRCTPASWNNRRGQVSCWRFECDNLNGLIAFEPSSLIIPYETEHCGFAGCENRLSGKSVEDIIYRGPNRFQRPDGNLNFVSIPAGVKYNNDGSCSGPFDHVIQASQSSRLNSGSQTPRRSRGRGN